MHKNEIICISLSISALLLLAEHWNIPMTSLKKKNNQRFIFFNQFPVLLHPHAQFSTTRGFKILQIFISIFLFLMLILSLDFQLKHYAFYFRKRSRRLSTIEEKYLALWYIFVWPFLVYLSIIYSPNILCVCHTSEIFYQFCFICRDTFMVALHAFPLLCTGFPLGLLHSCHLKTCLYYHP